MKRLLAYLFIVLGFGIILNDEAEASKWEIVYKNYLDGNIYSAKHKKKIFADSKAYQNCVKDKSSIKGQSKKITNNTWSYGQGDRAQNCLQFIIINPKGIEQNVWQTSVKNKVGNKIFETFNDDLNKIMSIAKKTSRWSNDSAEQESRKYKYHCITRDYKNMRRLGGCGYDIDARTFLDIKMVSEVISDKYGHDPKLFWKKLLPLREEITQNYLKSLKTQIAKAEASQTQNKKTETTVKLYFKGQYPCLEGDTSCGKFSPSSPISFEKWKSRKKSFNKNGLCFSPKYGQVRYLQTIDNCDYWENTYSTKYYRLINLKGNTFKIDGYQGKVALKNFPDPTGLGEGSSSGEGSEEIVKIDQKHLCVNEFNEKLMRVDKILKDQNNKCKYKFYRQDHSYIYKRLISSAIPSLLTGSSGSNQSILSGSSGGSRGISKEGFNKIIAEGNKETGSTFAKVKIISKNKSKVKKITYKFCVARMPTWYWTNITMTKCKNNEEVSVEEFIKVRLTRVTGSEPDNRKPDQRFFEELDKLLFEFKTYGISEAIIYDTIEKDRLLASLNKKNVKIVKKELNQEEFKPKKSNQDNEAPVIEIAEVITVNDTDYEFQGKVTDQAKTIYVEIDGRPTDVKNGKFIVKGYSPIDKQISIEAIDQWGNRSEPKIVKLKIDIKDTIVAEKLEPLNPSKIRAKSNSNKVALIIGIEEYKQTPAASYANLDAKFFYEYARKGFGVSKNNIKILIDEDANLISSLGTLKKWLPGKIKSNQTELIVFFAGHGLASSNGEELYLLPQDSDPDLLERTALSRNELFETIIRLNPKNVTMFFDTCFSGISRDEKTLLASARPIRIIASEEQDIPDNFTIFSASQLDQISSGIKEAKHGIFSYYLMKGLEGYADVNKDKKITNGELLAYMDENVSQKASELGRQQNPSLAGDPNKVLISYR